ncbi:hypothetical protein C7999DRAFT_15789 [Corynascus novoguineensis]|uniref:DUF4604 domain-containing protein n=1 Tax=Corynascus novoguineensis TaxID=1126955 RepID=A0AAN7CSH3_9PEZI|nr:hypothetical protein C7999DRAFT_15789 [Corynascus novoguineensis]
MSQKITAKNLQYNTTLPPFLARLRGQHASETDRDGPDPILAARRRAVKPRSKSAEAEDAPLVVDEHGNALDDVAVDADGSVKEKEAEAAGDRQQQQQEEDQPADLDTAMLRENLAGVGDQRKKRKIGKIIGTGADEEEGEGKGAEKRNVHDEKSGRTETAGTAGSTERDATEKDGSAAAGKTKAKKKAKKIKLSFGDDEG